MNQQYKQLGIQIQKLYQFKMKEFCLTNSLQAIQLSTVTVKNSNIPTIINLWWILQGLLSFNLSSVIQSFVNEGIQCLFELVCAYSRYLSSSSSSSPGSSSSDHLSVISSVLSIKSKLSYLLSIVYC